MRRTFVFAVLVLCTVLLSPLSMAETATPQEMERVCRNWLAYMVGNDNPKGKRCDKAKGKRGLVW